MEVSLRLFTPWLLLVALSFTACSASDSPSTTTTSQRTSPPATGTAVQVSVSVSDPDHDRHLHYRWAATEGTINNVDRPTTTWTVPPGSGLQFAYVLVSDGKGGYTEKRVAALTMATVTQPTSGSISPPGDSSRNGFIWGTLYYEGYGRHVYLPDWDIQITGPNAPGTPIKTDMKGEFFLAGLNAGTDYGFSYRVPGQNAFSTPVQINTAPAATSPSASGYRRQKVTLVGTVQLAGQVRLSDQSYCGIRDEFFSHSSPTNSNMPVVPTSATAELLDSGGTVLAKATVNHYGDYFLVLGAPGPAGTKVRITCEGIEAEQAKDLTGLSGQQTGPSFTLPNQRPIINNVTVTLNGNNIGRPDLPEPTVVKTIPEMDLAPGDDAFLSYKGLDTRKGACAYYHKIGAVEGCDNEGFPFGKQLTLDEWKQRVNLSPFHDGNSAEPEFKAIYINKFDLNFARDMQGIKRANGDLAYNVCNYPGPQDVNDPLGSPKKIGEETEADINLSIENARRGIGKIACVAMEYSSTNRVNNGERFVKFYTFGPTGKLLLSISLDGRREKFMPGSCTACHGGDAYGGKFPDNYNRPTDPNDTGTGQGNLGSYFLPLDIANFKYSTSNTSLSRASLLAPLRRMNELLASSSGISLPLTADASDLILNRWYTEPTSDEQQNPTPRIYLPNGQACAGCHNNINNTGTGLDAVSMHGKVIRPSCQICHSSNARVPDGQGLPEVQITLHQRPPGHYLNPQTQGVSGPHTVCGGSKHLEMNHVMPNALATFERFWLSKLSSQQDFASYGPDQISTLFQFASIAPTSPNPQNGSTCNETVVNNIVVNSLKTTINIPKPHPGL